MELVRLKVWPAFINDEEIRIDRLDREKAAEPSPSTPSDNQIQPRNLMGTDTPFWQASQVPLPVIVHQQVHPDPGSAPRAKLPELFGELGCGFDHNAAGQEDGRSGHSD